jgi:hypothetical protein
MIITDETRITVTIPPATASAKLSDTMAKLLRHIIVVTPLPETALPAGVHLNTMDWSPNTIRALVRRGFITVLATAEWGAIVVDVTDAGLEWAVENLTG